MAFAVLKLSYNNPGDATLTGGICGSGFFIDSSTAITAHHALNNDALAPNVGYKHVRLWLIGRNGATCVIPPEGVATFPEIDTTVIRFPAPVFNFPVPNLASGPITAGISVNGIGHVGNAMPSVDAQWHGSELVIRAADISQLVFDRYGEIKRPLTLNINALDVKMQNVRGFELSFGSQVGMSGGPVIDASTHSVLGMLSIGLPADANIKTQTFAISMGQIMERIV
jgi:hypothetical protein